MNSEKTKQSKNNQGNLLRAGCSAVFLIVAVLLGFAVTVYGGTVLVGIFFLIALSDSTLNLTVFFTVLSIVVLASIVGVVFVGGKNIEHLTHVVVRYRGMQHERKRIESLMQKGNSQISDDNILVDAQDNDNIKKHSQH